MRTINVHAAKKHFLRLVDQVSAGAEIVIAKAGKPVAKLVPLAAATARAKRRLGALQGRAKLPRNFDASLPEALVFFDTSNLKVHHISVRLHSELVVCV